MFQIVFNLEAHVARKILRAFADDQVVIGVFKTAFATSDGVPHAFERGHRSGAFLWSMHAGRIKLHDAFGIRQPAIADAVVERIKLHDIYPGYHGVKHVRALRDHREGLVHCSHVAAVLEAVAIGGRDDDRLDAALDQDVGKLGKRDAISCRPG